MAKFLFLALALVLLCAGGYLWAYKIADVQYVFCELRGESVLSQRWLAPGIYASGVATCPRGIGSFKDLVSSTPSEYTRIRCKELVWRSPPWGD